MPLAATETGQHEQDGSDVSNRTSSTVTPSGTASVMPRAQNPGDPRGGVDITLDFLQGQGQRVMSADQQVWPCPKRPRLLLKPGLASNAGGKRGILRP